MAGAAPVIGAISGGVSLFQGLSGNKSAKAKAGRADAVSEFSLERQQQVANALLGIARQGDQVLDADRQYEKVANVRKKQEAMDKVAGRQDAENESYKPGDSIFSQINQAVTERHARGRDQDRIEIDQSNLMARASLWQMPAQVLSGMFGQGQNMANQARSSMVNPSGLIESMSGLFGNLGSGGTGGSGSGQTQTSAGMAGSAIANVPGLNYRRGR